MSAKLASDKDGVSLRVAMEARDPIERLRGLKSADEELGRWLVDAVAEARSKGCSWAEIGEALGVSRQAAWQLYNRELKSAIASARRRSKMSEDEALTLARSELSAVRSRRRR
ncbi:MAG: hypothetical protein ACRD6W_03500 [Nitrososphaerales archaeon]